MRRVVLAEVAVLRSTAMAMQGKTTSGDKTAISLDEADAAADAFRPSWDAGDDGGAGGFEAPPPPSPAAAAAPTATTAMNGSQGTPQIVPSPAMIVGSPVVALGQNHNINETAPFAVMSAPTAATALGVPPAPGPTHPHSANDQKPNVGTQLGGISPAAAAVVAAANAANAAAARMPVPSSEALDSASVIEAVPFAAPTAPMPHAPTSSTPGGLGQKAVSSPPPAMAPVMVMAAPATATSAARAAALTQAPAQKPARAHNAFPAAAAAVDPFKHSSTDDDYVVPGKKSSKWLLFGAAACVVLFGAGLFLKFGMNSEEAKPSPTPSANALGPAVQSPTNDIPPPPPKDEIPTPPPATPTKAEPASPHAKADPPAPKAAPDPPKTVAAATPRNNPPAPRAAPLPPAPQPTPKTAPKSTGGGIVRDSPF